MEVFLAEKKDRDTLMALLEKYLYEFSQWDKCDVNDDGLYGYEYLDCYFEEEHRYPYLIKVDGKIAGLILVSDYPEVPEFFVLHKYRRNGYGKKAVFEVFDKHHGKWQLKRHPHNTASVYFWDNVVNEYTKGNYRLVKNYPNNEVDYNDGTPADVFFFEN